MSGLMFPKEGEVDLGLVLGAPVAVLGYGNQGRAHALNLRDSGADVRIGARPGRSFNQASADGFEPASLAAAAEGAGVVVLALPDEVVGKALPVSSLATGSAIVFLHGFAYVYGQVAPPAGSAAVLVSPCGPGSAVRSEFVAGRGVTAFVAAEPESGFPLALAYATLVGCARAGLVRTTFREETECDLFGEQAVLCGGMPELARAAWETLVEAGFSPDVAYLECVQQIRLLADLVAQHGIAGMTERISDTAEWGANRTGPEVVGPASRQAMRAALSRIQSGDFAKEWLAEAAAGKPRLLAARDSRRNEPIEAVAESLRAPDKGTP